MKKTKDARAVSRNPRRILGFQVLENECLWMKAGVINFRNCDQAYNCNHCAFDTSMRKAMGIRDEVDSHKVAPQWVEHLRKSHHGASLPCRHVLTGRIEAPKICAYNYECHHCAFDQMLDDMDVYREPDAPDYGRVSGYRIAHGYYYHIGHNWVRFEHGGQIRIGIDDFAVKVFGKPDTVQLPPLGEILQQHEVGWTFGRDRHQAASLAPASGTVLAVNRSVLKHPDIIHLDPYRNGWLMILEPSLPKKNLKGLYFGDESVRWMESDIRQLLSMVGSDYDRLAATGAQPIDDVFGKFPDIGWETLVQTFLRTERV